jgi:PAS domain S-box-containing protein
MSLYEQLPMLVIRLSEDGTTLQVNPEVSRVTGYRADELLGRNFWAIVFPGRLFAQIPKFVSPCPTAASPLLRDVPMTLRSKNGTERTIAWTRFVLSDSAEGRSLVCVGTDLTDRLLESDKLPNVVVTGGNLGTVQDDAFSTSLDGKLQGIGDEIGVDPIAGDFVQPLAISPPLLSVGADGGQAIQDVHEFLTEVETRIGALEQAFMQGQMTHVTSLAGMLRSGAHACGLLSFSSAADRLLHAASAGSADAITLRVHELVSMAKGQNKSE